jgi:acetylornithine deacetylase/succinyl-diaminopimelate desuccinylase-like protein
MRLADVAVQPAPLSAQQQAWLDAAWGEIDAAELTRLVAAMTDIPSPTGRERALAEWLTGYLQAAGLEAFYQPIDAEQGNAVGRYRGTGTGPELLLYSQIDTRFAGAPAEDGPWIGAEPRADLLPHAQVEDGVVVGNGAENPKGFAACVVAAAVAVRRAGIPLRGTVRVGLGAGGMPINPPPGRGRHDIGHGSGCSFLLEQGVRGDFAVIAKPGWAVAWEEVGLAWFRVQVRGALAYAGTRHVLPYRNPIVHAARVIDGLEAWFPEYTARHTRGLVAPQGNVGAIEGGWPHQPAFTPALCHLYVDLRLAPRDDPVAVRRELDATLARIQAAHPELDLASEMIAAVPSVSTAPDNWIVQSCMRAWEAVTGEPHRPRVGTSGTTDAVILRGRGIPTARIGLPPPLRPLPFAGQFTMGAVEARGMEQLTRCLVYAIVDTCTRERGEVGLG